MLLQYVKQNGWKCYFLCACDSMNDTFQEIQHQQIGARSSVQPCSCPNTWNVSQIISRACRTTYYKYTENLAPASHKAATGHLSPLFKPWKGFLLQQTESKGVASQTASLRSTQPGPSPAGAKLGNPARFLLLKHKWDLSSYNTSVFSRALCSVHYIHPCAGFL